MSTSNLYYVSFYYILTRYHYINLWLPHFGLVNHGCKFCFGFYACFDQKFCVLEVYKVNSRYLDVVNLRFN